MSSKHHGGPAPIPPGNRPHGGSQQGAGAGGPAGGDEAIPYEDSDKFQEQDPQRRIGNYEQRGEPLDPAAEPA